MSDDSPFLTLDSSTLDAGLVKLLCRIAHEKGRVEIQNCQGGSCVMISKEELDSLEEALAILCRTDGISRIARQIQQFAVLDISEPLPAPRAGALLNT